MIHFNIIHPPMPWSSFGSRHFNLYPDLHENMFVKQNADLFKIDRFYVKRFVDIL
jgi:hypothetical protein